MIKPTKPGRANRIADQIQRDVAELIQKEVSNWSRNADRVRNYS